MWPSHDIPSSIQHTLRKKKKPGRKTRDSPTLRYATPPTPQRQTSSVRCSTDPLARLLNGLNTFSLLANG
ncbi:hypothetical protein BJV74DRAFT_861134 [Russula compacta]|nr:hypothetical protein BJV74DRAFT_861134 [Russula compacta]